MKKLHSISAATVLAMAFALVTPSLAFAGKVTGRIASINVVGSSTTPYAMVNVTGTWSGNPGCSQWPPMMAVDISTTRGKAVMAVLTSAFLAGKNITLRGANTCVTPSNQEAGAVVTVEAAYYVVIEQ